MPSLAAFPASLPEHAAADTDISVLPRIFEDECNIAILQRHLPADIALSAQAQCQTQRPWQYSWLGSPDESFIADLRRQLPAPEAGTPLLDDMVTIAEAIAFLFDTETIGVRLTPAEHCHVPAFSLQ